MTNNPKYTAFGSAFGVLFNEPMDKYTSFRVGGPADMLAMPQNSQSLVALLKAAKKESIPVTIIGGGTNTLVSDKGIRGLVIVLRDLKSSPGREENTILAHGGERLSTIVKFAMDNGLSGLEFAAGIPGSLGGAIMMNAGTKDWDISRVIQRIDVIDTQTLAFKTMGREDLAFGYRGLETPDIIIVSARLALVQADPVKIKKTVDQNMKTKKKTQPVSQKSAGCFFKNPSSLTPAGKLIEDAGLKGKQINGAMISKHHANFIVNIDNASCKDILALKNLVQKTVFEKFKIQLETEVKVTGE